jgi:hypothetical protein
VILDVVYGHTGEGSHLGPTLSLRGIDNASYYRLLGDNPRYYMDYTGCGNTLNMMHPRALQLIMDTRPPLLIPDGDTWLTIARLAGPGDGRSRTKLPPAKDL